MRIDLGDGYLLREFRDEDLPSLVRHANDPEVARTLEDRFPHPYTEGDGEKWLALVAEQKPLTHFAIANASEVIGGIGLQPREDVYRCTGELGYWLGRRFWGRGIATRAVRAMTAWGFRHLRLTRIQARVFETNPASARVLQKAGFTCEGRLRQSVIKQGRVMDQHVYAILRSEFEALDRG